MQDYEVCLTIDRALAEGNITRTTSRAKPEERFAPFRVGPEPFMLHPAQAERIEALGSLLHRFYRAADELYYLSVRGEAPAWIAEHLDAGKPLRLLELARHPAFIKQLPIVIRPDLLITTDGLRATELDSVPGSMGLLGFMEQVYGNFSSNLLGDRSTVDAFAAALSALAPGGKAAIVISDECSGYRHETAWLSAEWAETGLEIPTVRPEDLSYTNDGVWLNGEKLDLVYRFFELFDMDNVPGSYQLFDLAATGKVTVTPPPKPHLEEKMWFAFLHHPELRQWWLELLGNEDYQALLELFPHTWLLTPNTEAFSSGPHGSVDRLKTASRRERPFVIKPSGFSPLAWGGHGFSRGKDYTTRRWAQAIDDCLAQAYELPHVLQDYQHSDPILVRFYDFTDQRMCSFSGKVRLCPYYFVIGEGTVLSGALATIVPLSKPVIHGMTEAVMVPTAVLEASE